MKKELVTTEEIHGVLLDIGIPPNLLGFAYITAGIELALQDPEYIMHIGKLLYVDVAVRYKTTPACVERCIRKAIETAWALGNFELICAIFRTYSAERKPKNSHFMAMLYYHIAG